jgi:hypothetical protein
MDGFPELPKKRQSACGIPWAGWVDRRPRRRGDLLATDDSNFVAGESLYVDAGYSNAAVTEDAFVRVGPDLGRFEVPPQNK